MALREVVYVFIISTLLGLGCLVIAVLALVGWAGAMEKRLTEILSEEGRPWPPK